MSLELEALFERGVLVRPSHLHGNLVHLVRALAHATGVADVEVSPPVEELGGLIGMPRHLIFVLLDGLGMNIVRRLPADSFLVRSLRRELNATCPSTTACALTSVATAQYPNRHAVTGWFTHLPEYSLTAAILPFVERFSGESLLRRGITPEDVLPLRPICPRMRTHRPMTFVPALLADTAYNRYTRCGTPGVGYANVPAAMEQIVGRVLGSPEPTYTHLYMPEVDTICHKLGVDHPDVVPLVMGIDAALGRLAGALGDRACIVVSADHGLIDVPSVDQTLLVDGDPLLATLVVPPTGDARMPIFHVREGARDAFDGQFRERFRERMVLLETADAERMELLGPGPLSETARARFGDFLGIPFGPTTLSYHPPGKPVGHVFRAVHAGLSPEEMRVPLCVS